MSDQTETSSPSSKRHPVADSNVTPGGETKSDQPTTSPAPVPLPAPDPALPSRDQEIVE